MSRIEDIYKGNARRVIVPCRDERHNPIDISGAESIEVAVASRPGDDILISKTLAESDIVITGSNDAFYFDLTPQDTGETLSPGSYVIEAKLVTSSGLPYTLYQIPLRIRQTIID